MTPETSATGVVIPTVGRPSLLALLRTLAEDAGPLPRRIVVVDDRPKDQKEPALSGLKVPARLTDRLILLRSWGRGPAAARNAGWQLGCADCEWVAFVDDDVLPCAGWLAGLSADLAAAGPRVGGIQGRVTVPLPSHRRPTDWERGTAGLSTSRWITADLVYRRAALEEVGGFDERFPRAFREDADLALRVQAAGWQLTTGARRVLHPVRPASWNASVRQQRGNADDPLMRRLHGKGWGTRAAAPVGRRSRHAAITAAAASTVVAAALGRPQVAKGAAIAWLVGTCEFAWARIKPGPRTPGEIASMTASSVLIPPLAITHWLRGTLRWRRAEPWSSAAPATRTLPTFAAVLFDRDGTLVKDVPYNGDPDLVELQPGAQTAVATLRAAGLRTGVVSNQSGIARGLLTWEQVDAVNARIDALAGTFEVWSTCPHGSDVGCDCRKPAPGLVIEACTKLDVTPQSTAVVGDIDSDIAAAEAAGATGVLVPTEATEPTEVANTAIAAFSLTAATSLVLSTRAATGAMVA
jgi:histidinol-phosphate phosphatase family protein